MTNSSIAFLEKYVGLVFCALLTAIRRVFGLFGNPKKADQPTKKLVFVKFIEQGALVLHKNTFQQAVRQYGGANVYICTFKSNAQLIDLLEVIPNENKILIDEKSFWQFTKNFWQAVVQIRKFKIDTAIDLEFYSCATAIFCYLTGATKRAGYHRYMGSQNYRGDLFTHKLSYSHYVNVSASGWSLLKSLDVPSSTLPALDIPMNDGQIAIGFQPTTVDLNNLKTLLGFQANDNEPIIIINPSLNDVLPLRKWPANNFHQFILTFKQQYPDYKFVFTGRTDEAQMTQDFIASLSLPNAVNLCGKTELRDIFTLYSCSRLLVTSDSGPAHFAALTTVETIVLFGPETPALYAPLSPRTHVLYNSLPCSPCYNVYNNRQSPCKNNLCMQSISVAQVMEAANKILA